MHANYRSQPKSPEINMHNCQPMSAYHTNPSMGAEPTSRKKVKTMPTENEYEELIRHTLQKMHSVWIDFYQKYAQFCESNFQDFDFPSVDDIFIQFENYLKRHRVPDRPIRKNTEKAPYTYGDWKRMREGASTSSLFNNNNDYNKSQSLNGDSGWDATDLSSSSSLVQAKSTNSRGNQNTRDDDWEAANELVGTRNQIRTPSYDDLPRNATNVRGFKRRGNIRGGFGGRGRSGSDSNNRHNNNDRYNNRNDSSSKKDHGEPLISSGWDENEETATPAAASSPKKVVNDGWEVIKNYKTKVAPIENWDD